MYDEELRKAFEAVDKVLSNEINDDATDANEINDDKRPEDTQQRVIDSPFDDFMSDLFDSHQELLDDDDAVKDRLDSIRNDRLNAPNR